MDLDPLTSLVIKKEATNNMVILAVDLLFRIESPEDSSHQRGLPERVDSIHRCFVGQKQGHQLWDAISGCCVQRCFLFIVVAGYVDFCTSKGRIIMLGFSDFQSTCTSGFIW